MTATVRTRPTRPTEVRANASTFRVDHHARLPRFVGAPDDASRRLTALRVAVVGAGAVGGRLVDHLARLGVAALCVVDRGRFKPESVSTQPVMPDAVGMSKAVHTARLAARLSLETRVSVFDGPVQALEADAFHDADAVFLATDNLEAEIDVGQRCAHLGRPLIQASVHGETLTAQVRVFANRPLDACLACGYTREEWGHVDRGTRFACDPAVDPAEAHARAGQTGLDTPTTSIAPLCAMASDLAVFQLVRRTLRLGERVDNCVVTYCGYTHATTVSPLAPNASCRCDHRPVTVVPAPERLSALSLAALRQLAEDGAGGTCGLRAVAYAVDDTAFISHARCVCGEHTSPARFVARGDSVASCTVCGEPLLAEPYFAHSPVPCHLAADVACAPLDSITARPPRLVTIWGDTSGVCFREEDHE